MFVIAHVVTCVYCKAKFDRDKVPTVPVGTRRYAHKQCYEEAMAKMSQDEKDKLVLENYIKKLFNTSTISTKIKRQIDTYVKENGYTYSGITKSLIYFYEIKQGSIAKANGGIGIVPYIYQDAYNYYYNLWLINQKNRQTMDNNFQAYKEVKVHIPVPEKKPKIKKLFSFLDDEVDNE